MFLKGKKAENRGRAGGFAIPAPCQARIRQAFWLSLCACYSSSNSFIAFKHHVRPQVLHPQQLGQLWQQAAQLSCHDSHGTPSGSSTSSTHLAVSPEAAAARYAPHTEVAQIHACSCLSKPSVPLCHLTPLSPSVRTVLSSPPGLPGTACGGCGQYGSSWQLWPRCQRLWRWRGSRASACGT